MAAAVNDIVRHARRVALLQGTDLPDGELLFAFVNRRDEAAFAALVRRHGPMVLGVCRRVLRHEADAEDAFQATFLVLARKAKGIRAGGAVGNWLYRVAHTTAIKAKAMNRKRRMRELEAGSRPRHEACEEVWQAVQALLDAELASLPDKYRAPIVLCDLEGSTILQAARHLGCPQGTVASRLSRGRALLAQRLARHGLVISVSTLIAALAHGTASAALSPMLLDATVRATGFMGHGVASAKVIALTQGVIQAMFLSKLRACVAGCVAMTMLVTAVGSIGHGIMVAPASAQDAAPGKQAKQDEVARLRAEVEQLRAQLEQTRRDLVRAEKEIVLLKAQADLVRAQAEVNLLRAQAALAQQKQKQQPVPVAPALDDPRAKAPQGAPPMSVTAPDGRTVATTQDQAIMLIDAQTGQILFKSLGHTAPITALAFSPDGKLLASGGKDKAVYLWSPPTGKQLRKIILPGPVSDVRFSEDAKLLLILEGDGTRHEVDVATGKELRVIRGEQAK
jgi:RNA polymerase sigma factor (sigma-70 family)